MPAQRPELESLIDALERAALHGHGGAYFPTATKLRAVAAQRSRHPPVIVVNASEGEPLSRKDRFLLVSRTDQVLQGVRSVAEALGADTVVIAVDQRRVRTREVLETALGAGAPAGPQRRPVIEVIGVPHGFVTGQESALINFLNGREAVPTLTPPYPFEKGVLGRPTLVSNVETFAQIARVLTGEYDASRLITVSGAVPKPAVVRVHSHTTVRSALDAAGGLTEEISAVLLGGYGGTWAALPAALDLRLDEPTLRASGLTLGAGIVHPLARSRCGVAEVARVTRWMAGESAGQCGPCVFGLEAIASALDDLCGAGPVIGGGVRDGRAALSRISRWCHMVTGRGACAHPDGVARYVNSALTVMASQFAQHATRGPCRNCARTYGTPPGSSARRGAGRPGARTQTVLA